MGIVSGLNGNGSENLQRHEKIENLVRGLVEVFGSRAEDIARNQFSAATAGSETAEAWRLILDELTALPPSCPPPGHDARPTEPPHP